uniref:Uncharacterized protein n=1 Tax=Lepeophtheirus salmonis TaxID=72036 RepID=A0A0K2U083_LEPSM
MEYKVKVYNS